MTDEFLIGLCIGAGGLAILLTMFNCNPRQIEEKIRKEAVMHNVAHFEVDTNGVVSFKWNK